VTKCQSTQGGTGVTGDERPESGASQVVCSLSKRRSCTSGKLVALLLTLPPDASLSPVETDAVSCSADPLFNGLVAMLSTGGVSPKNPDQRCRVLALLSSLPPYPPANNTLPEGSSVAVWLLRLPIN